MLLNMINVNKVKLRLQRYLINILHKKEYSFYSCNSIEKISYYSLFRNNLKRIEYYYTNGQISSLYLYKDDNVTKEYHWTYEGFLRIINNYEH